MRNRNIDREETKRTSVGARMSIDSSVSKMGRLNPFVRPGGTFCQLVL